MIYFTCEKRRPQRINFRATDIVIYYNCINDFPKASISTIKAFTDDINTVNVEYLINKELHIINIWLKLHTDALIVFYCILSIQLN